MTAAVEPANSNALPVGAGYGDVPRSRAADLFAMSLAVLALLIYAQIWVFPLIGDSEPHLDAGAVLRLGYYPAYAAGLLIAAACWRSLGSVLVRSWLLVLLVALAAASVSWSVDPSTTTRRAVAVVLTSLTGAALAARFDWRQLAVVVGITYGLIVALSYGAGIFAPGLGRMHALFPGAWRGLWSEKNALGGNMAMGFGLFAGAALLDTRRRWIWSGFAALALGLVLLSTSKTSLVALLLGAAVIAFIWMARRGPVAGVVMVWLAVVAGGLAAALALVAPQLLLQALGKDATLTGRTQLWSAALRQAHTRPILGFGYGAIWDNFDPFAPLASITHDAAFRARHAHSSWVELRLNLGWAGVTVWGLWLAETWIRGAAAVFTSRGAYLAMPFIAIYSMISLTESVTLIWNDLRWALFAAFGVKLALGERSAHS